MNRYILEDDEDGQPILVINNAWDIEPTPQNLSRFDCYVGRTLDELEAAWREPFDVEDNSAYRHLVLNLIQKHRFKEAKHN